MILTFFKAAPPYDKTNGMWEQMYWTNGFTGPLALKEAQRLAGLLGGRYFNIELPEIKTMTAFLERLGATLPEGFKETIEQSTMTQPVTVEASMPSENELREKARLAALVDLVMNSKAAENKKRLADVIEELPAYAEQVKMLSNAKERGEFDFTEYIGTKRDIHSVLKAFSIYMLKDNFKI
jgi:hypothetical protein